MKSSTLAALAVAAFVTAAGIHLVAFSPTYQVVKIEEKKSISISCSPLYIPNIDEMIPALPGWGNYRWKITTDSDSAQFYFDQGINMYYGFHIIEARASFHKAVRFDPDCAMAWYGKALAFGPNINDFGYEPPSEALPAAKQAEAKMAHCTPVEKALIKTMMVRYNSDTTIAQSDLNQLYANAMAKVYKQFPQQANVATLYADALMLLHPWDFYEHNFTPKPWTPEVLAVLKHAMRTDPKNPGAHHYFIHTTEASARPAQALQSANYLATAMPGVSHVTHMPSHIYIRTGYYNQGIQVNDRAVAGYHNYLSQFAPVEENVPLYELHNLHMKISCAQLAGNYRIAATTATELQKKIPAIYLELKNPLGNYAQYLHQSPVFVQLRFGKWNDLLDAPINDSLSYTAALQHFGRAIALARTGRLAEAINETGKMEKAMEDPLLKEPMAPMNAAYEPALVGLYLAKGVIAEEQKNMQEAKNNFRKATGVEDRLIYNEPRDWLLPARHYLGNALIKTGQFNEAIKVFNEDLAQNPGNGWALTGLQHCYKKKRAATELATAGKRLRAAWIIKDVPISSAVF